MTQQNKCPQRLGYMRQRPRGEEIPDECLTCEKIIECMRSKPNSSKLEIQPKIPIDKELRESPEAVKLEEAVKPKAEPLPSEPSGTKFIVDKLGMLFASWSSTVRINRETLSSWGEKIREVEIETVDGKRTRCKVMPMEGSEKGIIKIPDKMQLNLGVRIGEFVRVKPIIEKHKKRRFGFI